MLLTSVSPVQSSWGYRVLCLKCSPLLVYLSSSFSTCSGWKKLMYSLIIFLFLSHLIAILDSTVLWTQLFFPPLLTSLPCLHSFLLFLEQNCQPWEVSTEQQTGEKTKNTGYYTQIISTWEDGKLFTHFSIHLSAKEQNMLLCLKNVSKHIVKHWTQLYFAVAIFSYSYHFSLQTTMKSRSPILRSVASSKGNTLLI